MKLTTAIFLILMGSLLEYSANIDLYILSLCLGVGVSKFINGFFLLKGKDFLLHS